MIEPNMATLITLLFTDAADLGRGPRPDLPAGHRSHVQLRVDRHRHLDQRHRDHHGQRRCRRRRPRCIRARPVRGRRLVDQTGGARRRGRREADRGRVERADSPEQAKRVAKAIVNSPLVKTAVHGADPNWGRVAMAIGKSTTTDEVDQSKVVDPLRRPRGVPVVSRRRRARRARRRTCEATRFASRPSSPPAMHRPRCGAVI